MKLFAILTGIAILSSSIIHAQLTAYESGGKWGFKDSKGSVVVPAKYTAVGEDGRAKDLITGQARDVFTEGISPVNIGGAPTGVLNTIEGGKWGFVNAAGKEITSPKYDDVKEFKNGYAVVTLGGMRGLVNSAGKEVLPTRYKEVQQGFTDGLAMVLRDGRWGYADESGKEIIPLKFYHAFPFSDGMAAVSVDSPKSSGYATFHSYGFIDKSGRLVIPANYTMSFDNSLLQMLSFDEGQAQVKKMGVSFYIDKAGKQVAPSIKHQLFDVYADSYNGFKKTMSLNVLQHDAARNVDYYAVEAPINAQGTGGVRETVGMSGDRKLYFLSYDRTTPTGAAAADAALPAMKALIDEAVKQGWSFTSYMKDYGADKEGNVTMTVTERTNGLPDPRKQKMRLTEGEKKIELVIIGK